MNVGYPYPFFPHLNEVLTNSSLNFPVLVMMDSDPDLQIRRARAFSLDGRARMAYNQNIRNSYIRRSICPPSAFASAAK